MPRYIQTVDDLRRYMAPIIKAGRKHHIVLPINFDGSPPMLIWDHPATFTIEYIYRGKRERYSTEDPQAALDFYFTKC